MTPEKITTGPLPYLLYAPETEADARLPLILFLHGSGERGDDLEKVKTQGLPELVTNLLDAAFLVAPQCPENARWTDYLDALEKLLDEVIARHAVDTARIYLTGLSLGGQGAWFLAARSPERFAALAPVCGRSNPKATDRLKNLPTWVFHGADDDTVPLDESEKMVQALEEAGGDVRLTVYPDTGHDSWTRAYSEPDLYTWIFAQRRKS